MSDQRSKKLRRKEAEVARSGSEREESPAALTESEMEGLTTKLLDLTLRLSQEIDERKRIEEELREREAELAAVIEHAPIMMILLDRNRRIRLMNPAAYRFGERPDRDMIDALPGEALRCFHSLSGETECGSGKPCLDCGIRRTVLDTFATGEKQFRVQAKLTVFGDNGPDDLFFLVSTIPFTARGGEFVLVCLEDITTRLRAEEERNRLIEELKDALAQVRKLSGLIPICAYCKKIRDDAGYWNRIEEYISKHSEAVFSHGLCPECLVRHYPNHSESLGNSEE